MKKILCLSSLLFSILFFGQTPVTCTPKSTATNRFISSVEFLGTLNPDTINTSGYSPGGYFSYVNNPEKAKQVPGGAINTKVIVTGPDLGAIKAWVDWDNNGSFGNMASENVYSSTIKGYGVRNMVFGFIVPVGTKPGLYTIRIKTSAKGENSFSACTNLTSGETEDYAIEIIEDCAAKIISLSALQRCGPGPITLTAGGSKGTTSYRWYDSEFGPPISGPTSNIYTTGNLAVGSYIYYATALNGTCESAFRTPIRVMVNPTTEIGFSLNSPEICADQSSVIVTPYGEKEEVTLLTEKFEDETSVTFRNDFAGNGESGSGWQLQTSPYRPDPKVHIYTPAISSGYNGGRFANIITDIQRNSNLLNYFTLIKGLNTTGFSNLSIDYDLYYFPEENKETRNYLKLQYSVDGNSWTDVATYFNDVGIASRFQRQTFALPPDVLNKTDLKVRFVLFAYGAGSEWIADIVGIDNVRIYGEKPLNTLLGWTSSSIDIYDANCTTRYTGATQSVCIKPTDAQLENKEQFSVTATATLSNGCRVSADVIILNNNKIWNSTTSGNWNDTDKWKPNNLVPSADKCVIIKTPVVLGSGADGLAKKLTVMPGGSLNINSNKVVTVTDRIINHANAADFVVASDANLVQKNDTAVNTGKITVKRHSNMKRLDYTYWASPVSDQNLKSFSLGTVNTRFLTYSEDTDLFEVIDPVTNSFIPGKGYAVRSPNDFPADNLTYQAFNGVFTGVPTNGTSWKDATHVSRRLSFPLKLNGNGYNLVGNPYPSNIDFELLHALNSDKINLLAYFWTNVNVNPVMQADKYPNGGYVSNYAVLNGTAGTPATYSVTNVNPNNGSLLVSKTPNKYIKIGQGFIVKALVNNEDLIFNNSIRKPDAPSVFFNSKMADSNAVDRFWIQLTTPLNVVTTAAIGYKQGATNDFELDYDAPLMGLGSDAIFTNLGIEKLAIQGRQYPLQITDAVPLGTNHYTAGLYTIAVPVAEGIFANGRNIYLKDCQTGTVTNLSERAYNFYANAGLTEGRFEIVYQPGLVMGTDSVLKQNIIVYRDGQDFVVKSFDKNITGIEVYDASGRMLMKMQSNQKEIRLDTTRFVSGIYVLKIDQEGTAVTRKMRK